LVRARTTKRLVGRSRGKTASIRQDRVDFHLGRLRDAGLQGSEFEPVLDALREDKKVRQLELSRIASQYAGSAQLSFKNKDDAFETIKRRFHDRVRTQREIEIASKLTPS
jgi:hypothetical protein